jgi:type I restriction enzyme, S subunit
MKPTDALHHPSDWTVTTVAKAIELKRGISWSKEQERQEPNEAAVPVIRISNVQDRLKLDDILYLSGVKKAALINKRVTAGWSILVGSNGNRNRVGNAVLIDEDTDYLFASFLVAVRPKLEEDLDPRYFYRWLSSELIQARLSTSAEGSTGLNNLSHSFFRAMQISVPPMEEQKAIAQILDAADAAIEQIREAIACARALQASLISEAFDRMKGEQERLSRYITDVRYGTSQASNDKGWGNPTLRIPNVVGDEISFDDLVYVSSKPADVERLKLQDGDLLLVRTNGNPNYVGRSALFNAPDQQDWIFASYLIRVRLNDQLSPEYVNIFLGTEQGRRELLRRVTTSAGNNNINANSIRLLQIPIPTDQSEQKDVIEIAKASRAYISRLCDKLAAQEQLKKALMHDLLTGKMRVNAAELASVV